LVFKFLQELVPNCRDVVIYLVESVNPSAYSCSLSGNFWAFDKCEGKCNFVNGGFEPSDS
jgi:hypothetical protein